MRLKAAVLLFPILAACAAPAGVAMRPVGPAGPAPAWAPDIDPQMLSVIEQMDSFHIPPLHELTPFQARNMPSPTDAVEEIMMKTGMPPMPQTVSIAHMTVPGPGGTTMAVRTYTPLVGAGPFPVIIYYHGGGWVIANLDEYDPSARALATLGNAVVVSIAYRQGPESRFPAAHEDAFAAYSWAVGNAGTINGDPGRIAVAGESAGGNLAVAVAMMARDRGVRAPVHILSVYPIADGDTASPSYDRYAMAKPLNRPLMAWFFSHYLSQPADARNPLISLISANLAGLPPTTIINAEIDPLLSEGEELAQRMRSAGVDVVQQTYQGVAHEFFGMATLVDEAAQAQTLASQRLRSAFNR